jgi:large subunit ribosomal protein L24
VKTFLRKDDKVIITTGKDKKKTGKVVHVYPLVNKVMIAGLNMKKRTVRPNRDMPQGGVIEKESPLSISNVMLFCGKCNKGVKVGIKKLPDNSKMRFCKKCEAEI